MLQCVKKFSGANKHGNAPRYKKSRVTKGVQASNKRYTSGLHQLYNMIYVADLVLVGGCKIIIEISPD